MKIAFFGTGDFSKNILLSLLEYKDLDISLIVSQPDKQIGRKKILEETPVKKVALERNIEILQPQSLKGNNNFFDKLNNLDFIVVVAYGKIIPIEVLEAPKYGCINMHGSILPYYRGASPIQEAIKLGEIETGITIMYMSEGMDEGDILSVKKVNISDNDKTKDIFRKFENIGPDLLYNTLVDIINKNIKGAPQNNDKASYCSKIRKTDGEVIFSKLSAKNIYDKFRAYSDWPGIYTYYNEKKLNIEDCIIEETNIKFDKLLDLGKVIILGKGKKAGIGVICNGGIIRILQVKLEGKKSMDINSFINGNKVFLDYKFD